MKEKILKKPVISCLIIFAILILVHGFEAIVLRMDETVLGENCINKIFGIIVIFVVLHMVNMKPSDIGFKGSGFLKCICIGFALALISFAVSFPAGRRRPTRRGWPCRRPVGCGAFGRGRRLGRALAARRWARWRVCCWRIPRR